MQLGLIWTFEDVFPDEEALDINEYLVDIDKKLLYKVAAKFSLTKYIDSPNGEMTEAFKLIFGPHNSEFVRNTYGIVEEIEKKQELRKFFHPVTALQLFELAHKLEETDEGLSEAETEVAIFKAYLLLNQIHTQNQYKASESTNHLEGDKVHIPMMMFSALYPDHDKLNYNLDNQWLAQLIKSVYLFQFLDSKEEARLLLIAFNNKFGIENWSVFIKKYLPITMGLIGNKEASTIIQLDPNEADFDENCSFINKLILEEDEKIMEWDFLSLRSKPLIELEKGKYLIVFDLFVVEKVFKGMYFLLRDLNENLEEDEKVKDLRGLVTLKFSEQTILYKVLEDLYKSSAIKYSGEELDSIKIQGAPDYYIRKGSNILLFESKDFLIKADDKLSFDFELYEDVFTNKLYEEEDGSAKAVVQLINNIKKLLKKQFSPDTNYNYRDITIYPIVIVHDFQYDTPGLNVLIDSWFQEELSVLESEGYYTRKIKPLVIVNIDALLLNSIPLAKSTPLHRALDFYYEFIRINYKKKFVNSDSKKSYYLEKLIPFSLFLSNYLSKNKLYVQPSIMEIVSDPLFGRKE